MSNYQVSPWLRREIMKTAVRRRIAREEECEHVQRKMLRTMESPCQRESSRQENDNLYASFVSSDYGPSKLNLYLYVAEESRFLWTKAKDMFILKPDSEPKKGLLLFHDGEIDLKTFCWKQFEFDTYSTSYSCVKWNSSSRSDMVCVFGFGKTFLKNMTTATLKTLKDFVRNVDKSHIFVVTDSDEDKQDAVKFCKENKLCQQTHIFQTASDKSLLYETMYKILEKQISNFLSDLESRASATTRSVLRFTTELEILLGKLLLRTERHRSLLTKQCIAKIKSGNQFGIVGHWLCGDVLYIFEDEKVSTNADKNVEIRKSIAETFKGDIRYKSIRDILTPYCALKCGGRIENKTTGFSGTLGIFGELIRVEKGASEERDIVALSSGHLMSANTTAIVPTLGKIGVCIWPANSSQNILDVSIIKIDKEWIGRMDLILNRNITVADISKEDLDNRCVFKYGAGTGKTVGYIGVVDNFQMFGEDVITILPKRSQCPNTVFSDSGDSGAIVLTRHRENLHAIGVIYGSSLQLPELKNMREDTIAIFLKRALDRFNEATGQTNAVNQI